MNTIIYLCIFIKVSKKYVSNSQLKLKEQEIKINQQKYELLNLSNMCELNEQLISDDENLISKKNNILKHILNNIKKSVFIIDEYGYIVEKDRNFYEIWSGYEAYKNKGINIYNFLDSNIENKEEFIDSISSIKNGSKKINKEFKGKNKYFEIEFIRLSIENYFIGVLCNVEDITYKKNAERKIIENEIKYKSIVENIPYNIFVIKDNKSVYKNNSKVNLYYEDIKRLNKIMNEGKIEKEIKIITSNNEEKYKSIKGITFETSEGKKTVIAIKDITGDNEVLENLRVSQEKYKALIDLIPEGIYTLDIEDGKVKYINESLRKIVKREKQILEEVNDKLKNEILGNGELIKFTRKKIKDIDNNIIHIEQGWMSIDVSNKKKIIGIIRDITRQVEIEEIEVETEKRKVKKYIRDSFFMNMSHELKTPLNVIDSTNQLLKLQIEKDDKIKNKDEIIKSTKTIKKYTKSIRTIVENIISLHEIKCEIEDINLEIFNIVPIVEDSIEFIDNENISIIFDTQEEELWIKANKNHIGRIINTIVSTIIAHSKKKSMMNIFISKCIDNKIKVNIDAMIRIKENIYLKDSYDSNKDIGVSIIKDIMNKYNSSFEISIVDENIEVEIEFNEVNLSKIDNKYLDEGIKNIDNVYNL